MPAAAPELRPEEPLEVCWAGAVTLLDVGVAVASEMEVEPDSVVAAVASEVVAVEVMLEVVAALVLDVPTKLVVAVPTVAVLNSSR